MKPVFLACVTFVTVLGAPHENVDVKIIGGDDGDIVNYPFVLQLEYDNEQVCGAILVSSTFALTSGNCVAEKYIERFSVRAGSATLYEDGQDFELEEIVFHPLYNNREDSYGVALLLLSSPVSVPDAKPIELAANDDLIIEGSNVTVSGWGWTDFTYDAEPSSTLQVIELPILDEEFCRKAYDEVSEIMFCIGYLEDTGRGSCLGDYGGPAVIDGILVGIQSFGSGCGDGTHAAMIIRASKVKEWVDSVIKTYEV